MTPSDKKMFVQPVVKTMNLGGKKVHTNYMVNMNHVYTLDTADNSDNFELLFYVIGVDNPVRWKFPTKSGRDAACNKITSSFSVPFQSI